jgi:acetylornithine deacetylase/succinyl-diaminopimelate desuccinylase-like protein
MIDKVLKHLENDSENAVRRLIDVLSIPSISKISAYEQDVQRCGQWVADTLGAVGLEVSTYDTPGAPIVIGRWHNAGSAPHVLFYGHYDVQPPDPLGLWTTPPFEPDIRDGAIYARGASDDKGQVCCFIEALRAWHSTSGGFPVNITVMIEGEEESGSPHIKPFVEEHRDELLMRNGSTTDDHVDTFVLVSNADVGPRARGHHVRHAWPVLVRDQALWPIARPAQWHVRRHFGQPGQHDRARAQPAHGR